MTAIRAEAIIESEGRNLQSNRGLLGDLNRLCHIDVQIPRSALGLTRLNRRPVALDGVASVVFDCWWNLNKSPDSNAPLRFALE
jgi:hypothetical protein